MTLPKLDLLPFQEQEQLDQLDNFDYEGFLTWIDAQDDESIGDYLRGAYRYLTTKGKELDVDFWRKHYVIISLAIEDLSLQKYSALKNQILIHLKDLSTLLIVRQVIEDSKQDIASDDYMGFVGRTYAVVNMPELRMGNIVEVTWMLMRRILNSTDDVRFVASLFSGIAEIDNRLARLTLAHANKLNKASESALLSDNTEWVGLGEYDIHWVGFNTLDIEERDTDSNESDIVERTRGIMESYKGLWNKYFWGQDKTDTSDDKS